MAAATQMLVIPPQWLNLPEHEKENTSSNEYMITAENGEEKFLRPKVEPILNWQKQKFQEWLAENSQNMYPTREQKEKLADLLSASYVQITRLFANQRRRTHKNRKVMIIKDEKDLPKIKLISKGPSELKEEVFDLSVTWSERSSSPASSIPENENVSAICSAVADLIHVDQENKKCFEKITSAKKQRSRKRKNKEISREINMELTMDEILNKISREEEEDFKEEQMFPAMSEMIARSNSDMVNNSLLSSIVNEVVNQPPPPLPHSVMADVNPRLLQAMELLNNGVSWTHPAILSVLVQILHQQQQQQREQQFAQQRAYFARALNSPIESSPPPASESAYSHSSSKSTEELMSTLSPDECLAVNVLADLANEW